MRARYYDAGLGRFISEDPIGHNGGLNLYAYVGGNPINKVDPLGLVGDDINGRYGPIDQSGRIPRTGSPIEGPYNSPDTFEDKVGNKILDKILKQITGIGGLATRSPIAFGLPLLTHSKGLGGCNENGVCSDSLPSPSNSHK
jgi:uncharacterized protein RhaS with RHS repeats